ncbi:MAG: murein biosynthesis integral membrane protein MurJ [Rhodobacteraceae bacterium]|nr:murein biosynthesis integral membrane protein MurJ [Paracoccaceae bacterium]
MKLIGNSIIVGVWTLASRVLGFIRDILFAAILGTGPVAEAFLVAFALPNMFRRIFAEGALNLAFVPIYARKIAGMDDPDGFVSDVSVNLAAILLLLVMAAQMLMPFLVLAMASGFIHDGRFDLAILYGRVAFPYILFVAIAALLSAALNALGHFSVAAAAPIMLNVFFILTLTLVPLTGIEPGLALALIVPVAGLAQALIVFLALRRAGVRITLRRPRLTDDMVRLLHLALPAMLAGGVVQINLLVGRQVASYQEGGVAWLNYADRLCQLPLGVIGIAIGIVLLPDLSHRLHANDIVGSRRAFNRALEACLSLALPATVALMVAALPIISVLFERGAFDAADSRATALALAVYAAGLPAYMMQKILQPLYFAREDSRTPLRYALFSMLVNVAVAVGLVAALGYLAAALGTALAAWAMVLMLGRGAAGLGQATRLDGRNRRNLPRIATASLIMGLFLYGFIHLCGDLFVQDTVRYAALCGLVLGGLLVYTAVCAALGVWTFREIRILFRRRSHTEP